MKSPLLKTTKLIYCTEEQSPDNAADIKGNCYYRVGDVVEDQEGFYWVCVQPSFLGKKNNDSYWVNIFNAAESGKGVNTNKLPGIPAKFIYSKYNNVKKYNNNTIMLPTGLKENRQQIFNLSNLIWALKETDYYVDMIKDYPGLAGLPGIYHGKTYMRMLNEKWVKYGIYEKLFNRTESEMKNLEYFNFFYNGYHWKTGTTAGVWLYKSDYYARSYGGSVKGDDILFEMTKAGYGFDIRRYASDPKQDTKCASAGNKDMAPAKQFDGDKGYWVVRVATGKQLDKKYDPYKQMNNVYDIYNFNASFDFPYPYGPKNAPPTDEQLAKNEMEENEVYD